jgi:SET domain-containing protein
MKIKLAPGLTVRKSKINGKGCFATVAFHRGRKIAEYAGELITEAEAERRAQHRRRLRICAVNNRWSIDGSLGGNGTHYINHSCQPNCYMKIIYGHILFYALRDIEPNEEITLDYVMTLHPDTKRCTCGTGKCRGTINRRNKN